MGGAGPASAHPGATVFRIAPGVETNIVVLVPADFGKPITRVDLGDAPGFRLDGAQAPAGWNMTRNGDTISFSGGVIEPDDTNPVLFTLRGLAAAPGTLIFPVTTHSPDGTVQVYRGGPTSSNVAAVVYVGSGSGGGGTTPWTRIGEGAVVAVGAIGTAALVVRRRRTARAAPRS